MPPLFAPLRDPPCRVRNSISTPSDFIDLLVNKLINSVGSSIVHISPKKGQAGFNLKTYDDNYFSYLHYQNTKKKAQLVFPYTLKQCYHKRYSKKLGLFYCTWARQVEGEKTANSIWVSDACAVVTQTSKRPDGLRMSTDWRRATLRSTVCTLSVYTPKDMFTPRPLNFSEIPLCAVFIAFVAYSPCDGKQSMPLIQICKARGTAK